MNYQKLEEITKGKTLPLVAENDKGERIIIEKCNNGDLNYYQLNTFQKNDWVRINRYYEDGSFDETYER